MTLSEANAAVSRCFAHNDVLADAKLIEAHIVGQFVHCIIEFDNGARDSFGIDANGCMV